MKCSVFSYIFIFLLSCTGTDHKVPPGFHYDLSKPQKYIVGDALEEISGITFGQSNGTVYAIQDEDGILFQFDLSSKSIVQTKFGKKGDYEDVCISNGMVYVLKSNGAIYAFPLAAAGSKSIDDVAEAKPLPEGEYEGLFADDEAGQLYVLCKHCRGQKREGLSGYIITVSENHDMAQSGTFSLDMQNVGKITGDKENFHPSALAQNSKTKEWFILSSVNHVLIVADSSWKGKEVLRLDPGVFVQPEGIAFDREQNLYISNEAGTTTNGNILKFNYRP